MLQHGLTKGIKPAPFALVAGVVSIFSPPFVWGWWWYSPFPLTERSAAQVLRAKPLSAEKKSKKNFRAAGNDKNCPAGHRPAGQKMNKNV